MRRVLVITGSMGSGKTTVLGEASDILTARGIVHAAIDVDGLANGHFPDGTSVGGLAARNLRSICEHYVSIGVGSFLLAHAVESPTEMERVRAAVPAAT